MEEIKSSPFGLRVFIKKVDNPLNNFGKDIYEGIIVKTPTEASIKGNLILNSLSTNYKEIEHIAYNGLFGSNVGLLRVGTKVIFKYNQEIIDNDSDIYNVPIELIRSYINEE